jgi:hypothetical protein
MEEKRKKEDEEHNRLVWQMRFCNKMQNWNTGSGNWLVGNGCAEFGLITIKT